MNNPLIDICIPYYNSSKYFYECIESVVKQTYTNWSVSIFDDGSNIKEKEFLKKTLANTKYTSNIYLNNKNTGVYNARKFLIENSAGDIIIFLDADDELVNNQVLEKIVSEFKKNLNLDILIYNHTKNKSKRYSSVKKPDDVEKKIHEIFLKTSNFNSLCTKAIKNKYFKLPKIETKIPISEDRLISYYLMFTNKPNIKIINKALYWYRTNTESAMHICNVSKSIASQAYVENWIKQMDSKYNEKRYIKYISNNILYPSLWYSFISYKNIKWIECCKEIKSAIEQNNICLDNLIAKQLYKKLSLNLFRWENYRLLYLWLKFVSLIKKINWR